MYPMFTSSNLNKLLDRHYDHVRLTIDESSVLLYMYYTCNVHTLVEHNYFQPGNYRFPIFLICVIHVQCTIFKSFYVVERRKNSR